MPCAMPRKQKPAKKISAKTDAAPILADRRKKSKFVRLEDELREVAVLYDVVEFFVDILLVDDDVLVRELRRVE